MHFKFNFGIIRYMYIYTSTTDVCDDDIENGDLTNFELNLICTMYLEGVTKVAAGQSKFDLLLYSLIYKLTI